LVQSKTPLAEFPLTFTPTGIDIDHLNRILIKDSNGDIQEVKLFSDNMLIDYDNKEIIFKEKYDQVKVIK
jgi:hypothetical protein